MPTASNKVKFQYIGTTVPSTYDGDTIYFDNVNGNIKVGSNKIAEKIHTLILTEYGGGVSGSFDGGTATAMTASQVLTYYNQYYPNIKVLLEYQPMYDRKFFLPYVGADGSHVNLIFSGNIYNDYSGDSAEKCYAVTVLLNSTTNQLTYLTMPQKPKLTITITDIDNITGQFDTKYRTFSNITLTTGSWSDWAAALQNPDSYNLEIKWTPSDWSSHGSIDSYGHAPEFTLTNFTINNYFNAILFSIPITGGVLSSNDGNKRNDILEICVMPNSQEVKGCLRSTFKVCFAAPSPTSWPSSYTALTAYQNSDTNYTFTWGDILKHQYDLELQLFNSSHGGFISRTTNYVMGTDEVLFGPFMNNSSTLYMVDVMKNGSNSNTPTCVIKKV